MRPIPGLSLPPVLGDVLYVDPSSGNNNYSGKSLGRAFASLQSAVTALAGANKSNSLIVCAPGALVETVTIARDAQLAGLVIMGLGGRGAAFVEPSVEDAAGMIVHQDDVTLINLGVAGEDATSAVALTVTGARFRAERCKLEGGLTQLQLGPGTVAQVDDDETHGDAGDALFDDCEFTWGTNGVVLAASNYGAVTQARFRGCFFRNLSAAAFEESGATAAVHFRDLLIERCIFMPNEGAAPTKYLSLNDDNTNDGLVINCNFPTALNSGLNLVSTALLFSNNYMLAALSNGQPS